MLFNSVEFALFFVIVFALYTVLSQRLQNLLLLVASYAFYAAWDWRFLSLLIFTTCLDYVCGLAMVSRKRPGGKKAFLWLSVIGNLSVLGFFKYYGFFAQQLETLFQTTGLPFHLGTLSIILPIGISFYTFQSLSYSVDVYRGTIRPEKNIIDFALFVGFFPQLVAGPIERASRLLPQIRQERVLTWNLIRAGGYLFLWGLFKKCVIADNLALVADAVYGNVGVQNAGGLWAGTIAFAFQIYCDFSGYSDMARGLARCMGFELSNNFEHPYLSLNVREFWRRWHITLSRWLRDYVYIPLGGNRVGIGKTQRNVLITMTLGGLWHGASWNFLFWGLYHGFLLIAHRMAEPFLGRIVPASLLGRRTWQAIRVLFTFHLICLGWVFFRAQSMEVAWIALENFRTSMPLSFPSAVVAVKVGLFAGLLLLLEWVPYVRKDSLAYLQLPIHVRTPYYIFLFLTLYLYGAPLGEPFIYFQF